MTSIRGRAFIEGELRESLVVIEGDTIASVEAAVGGSELLLLPGFVDLHVHGGAGADFMDGESESSRIITHFHAGHGTTALAATTLSASDADLRRAIRSVHQARKASGAAEITAIHFEGPFLNERFAGAQDRASIRPPSSKELEGWLTACADLPVMMTIAPELEGALECIEHFRQRIIFSIGHTGATYEEAMRAFQVGARHVTHLFNAMPPLHHRQPGVIAAAIDSPDVTAEVIADGQHVAATMLRIATTLLPGRLALVTDAMRACGMGNGNYKLYEHDVTVQDGAARLASGALAGSLLTMDAALRFMVQDAGLPLESVIPFATEVPARVLGIARRKGTIRAGADADLVVMNDRLAIEEVWVRGERWKP